MLLAAQFAVAQKNLYVVTNTGELYAYPATKVSFSGSSSDDTNYIIINGHKFVDLGLPSGLLWAETNIGAETAADDGYYYAWGETTTKDTYTHDNYTYYDTSSLKYTKYISTDSKTVLDIEDDAAYVNWGSPCRMPTETEFDELINSENCTWTWTTKTNSSNETINGYEVTSEKNGNSIFLPASGFRYESYLDNHGSNGCYWSSTPASTVNYARCNLFSSDSFRSRWIISRHYGLPVRSVAEKNSGGSADVPSDKESSSDVPSDKDSLQDNTSYKIINGHKFINLGLPSGLLWAETNIGAETAADDGNYYAWGETKTKDTYTEDNYMYYDTSSSSYTKYTSTDGKTVLDIEDDAAYVNWGACRMPTDIEFKELRNTDNCKWTWTSKTTSSNETINGYEVTSKKNGNSIFLPASGRRDESYLDNHGSYGYSWSSTLFSDYTSDACSLYFFSGSVYSCSINYRYLGLTVRPVAEP